jgi:1-acyl-sn-glycerol-3-phosphate acyltransferase
MSKLIAFFKSSWIVFWWATGSIVFFVPITLAGLFSRTGNLAFKLCQAWVWWGKTIAGVRIETVGTERFEPGHAYVIIGNHQSLYDIPALMLGLGVQFRWVIKKSFVYVPLFGWALYFCRHVFIDRSNPKKAIKSMGDAVKQLPPGVSVAVFAEGTRSDDGVVRDFKAGGFLMALRGGLPIVPVTVNGSWRVIPDKRSLNFHPGPIQVVVGEPIETAGYDRKSLGELIERTREAVLANLDPSYPG